MPLDTREFDALVIDFASQSDQTKTRLKAVLRKVSLDASAAVKRAMPVDTGRARASWGVWDDAIGTGYKRTKGGKVPAAEAKNAAAASEGDSIWIESDDGTRITQGSNLPYIEPLNDGHSQQAAAGFLDVIAEQAAVTLETACAEVVNQAI